MLNIYIHLDSHSVENYMSKNIVSMSSQTNALEAAKTMLNRKISSILLTDETRKTVGIITEKDLLREICSKNLLAQSVAAGSVMSTPLLTIDKNLSMEDAAKLMVEFKVRHIAVEDKENGNIIGVITSSDLAFYVKNLIPDNYTMAPALFEALYCE
jgi:CBS domain-containing protein